MKPLLGPLFGVGGVQFGRLTWNLKRGPFLSYCPLLRASLQVPVFWRLRPYGWAHSIGLYESGPENFEARKDRAGSL